MLSILYHHTDPVGLLKKMRQALAPGGKLIIDCQGIAGEESMCLVPEKDTLMLVGFGSTNPVPLKIGCAGLVFSIAALFSALHSAAKNKEAHSGLILIA